MQSIDYQNQFLLNGNVSITRDNGRVINIAGTDNLFNKFTYKSLTIKANGKKYKMVYPMYNHFIGELVVNGSRHLYPDIPFNFINIANGYSVIIKRNTKTPNDTYLLMSDLSEPKPLTYANGYLIIRQHGEKIKLDEREAILILVGGNQGGFYTAKEAYDFIIANI